MAEKINLHYEEFGSGQPVVLLHGFPLNNSIWTPIRAHLQTKARIILPDLRGHGHSPAPTGTYSMVELAADIANLLDNLQLEKVVMAGHSMGGYVALAFAQAYPHRLQGLGLVASTPYADPPDRKQDRYDLVEKIRQAGINPLANSMSLTLTLDSAWIEPLRHLILQTPANGVIGSLLGMAEREDLTDFLQNLDLPTLLVAGDQDARIPLSALQMVSEHLRQGQWVNIRNCAHMPMLEAPDATARALIDLINHAQKRSVAS